MVIAAITSPDIHCKQFATLIVSGLSQRLAYTQVFGPCNCDATTDSVASEYIRKPKVQAEIVRLQAEANQALSADIAERRRILTRIARTQIKEEDITPQHVLTSVDTLNKMDKLYQDNKAEVNFGGIKILLVEGDTPLPTINEKAPDSPKLIDITTQEQTSPSCDGEK
jgi:hypothetical protein